LITLLAGLALAGVLVTLSVNANRTNLAAGAANAPAQAAGAADKPADKPAAEPPGKAAEKPADQADKADEKDQNAAPAAPASSQKVTWAGRTKGGKATVAITAKGGKAIAYVCDGSKLEVWLQGTAADGTLDLTAAEKANVDAKLTGTFGNGRAKGTLTVDGRDFTFNVGTVKKPSGLYRTTADVRGARLEGAWIVLADGTQVGLATFAGSTVPVAPLDTASRTAIVYGERLAVTDVVPGAGS
jgi:hypothetical protein